MSYYPGDYDNFFQKYAYDADNRLSHAYSSLDGIIWNEAARYFYYLHGPLARTEYGDDKVQGTDYTYTMQGWLKSANLHGINTMLSEPGRDGSIIANIPSSQINGRMGRDAMAYTLGYHNNDYTSINGITFSDTWTNFGSNLLPSVPGPKGLYNGNIATMITDHKGSTSGISGYAYQYDQLHRIRQAKNYNYPNTNSDNSFNTQYNYNPDGNITSLKRYGNSGSTMDDFSNYNYGNSALQPNTLKSLTDNVVAGAYQNDFDGSQTYTYDKIGNLTANSDQNTTVHWDVYNKVKSSTNNIGNTFYKYDGTGSRVFKTFENSPNYYVKDAQGNVLSIYGEFTGFRCNQQIQKECHLYGSSRLGVEVVNRTCNDAVHNNYMLGFHTPTSTHYELSNHLGNVLTTVTGRKLGIDENKDNIVDYYKPEVVQASDYYPFGSEMPGRTYRNPLFSETNEYRFGFNGKELDKSGEFGSLTHYDYGFRIYNPSIGKFLSVDPITDEYPELTPYQFASNRPIQGIDLDGLEFFIPTTLLSTSPVISTTSATTLMSSTNGLRALPRTLYENGNKIEPILYEPIKSPAGLPRYNPNLGRVANGNEMSKVGRIGHKVVESTTEFLKLFPEINKFMTRNARPDGWSIDPINKIIRIGEIKSATKTGLKNGIRQLARYSKEAQKKFGNDYTIETHLFRYNSLVPVTYIVQQGDNAWNISQDLGTSLENLQKLNPNVNDFSKLKIGQELIVDQVRFNDAQDPCENECSDN